MHGLATILRTLLAAPARGTPVGQPAGGSAQQMIPAWAMLGVLAVIVTALLGLVLLTLVRLALKRSVMRAEPEVYVDPPTGAWQVAGQRVKPITAGATPKDIDLGFVEGDGGGDGGNDGGGGDGGGGGGN